MLNTDVDQNVSPSEDFKTEFHLFFNSLVTATHCHQHRDRSRALGIVYKAERLFEGANPEELSGELAVSRSLQASRPPPGLRNRITLLYSSRKTYGDTRARRESAARTIQRTAVYSWTLQWFRGSLFFISEYVRDVDLCGWRADQAERINDRHIQDLYYLAW